MFTTKFGAPLSVAKIQMEELLARDLARGCPGRFGFVLHTIYELEFGHLLWRRLSSVPVATKKFGHRRPKELESLRVIVGHLPEELLPKMIRIHPPRKGRFIPIDRRAVPQQIDLGTVVQLRSSDIPAVHRGNVLKHPQP